MRVVLALIGTAVAVSAALITPLAAQAAPTTADSCATPAQQHVMKCFAVRRAGVAAALGTPAGYGPADLRSAYKLPTTGGTGAVVAIVDAYDNPRAESDLATYRAQYGLPACTTANGCFRKVNQNGAASPLPAYDAGWAGEISLDLDMVSAVCPSCKILLVEANSSYDSDLFVAEDRAVTLGAKYVSNSWGGGEWSSQATAGDPHFNHPGVVITASTGDSGYGASYPATSRYVTAVGGTSLTRATGTTRGWTEKAWSGAGSGCSAFDAKPTWQTVSTGCARRAEADVSAVADPNTGVAVYNGGWAVYGGTSAAAPIVAAVYALAGTPGATDFPAAYPYAHQSSLFDVTTGSNGTCGVGMCTARTGWDGPTGLGTPNGIAAFKAGGTTTPPAAPPAPTCTAAQLVANGGLESGGTSWTATAGVVSSTADGERPHTGSRYAWLNGYGVTHTDSLAQTVTVPAGCKTATLSYWLKITSADTGTIAYDKLTVKAGTTVLATYSNVNRTTGYVQKTFNLAAFIGKSVAVTFTGVEDASKATSFVLDDVALNVA
jgi:subtilase family serine protease